MGNFVITTRGAIIATGWTRFSQRVTVVQNDNQFVVLEGFGPAMRQVKFGDKAEALKYAEALCA